MEISCHDAFPTAGIQTMGAFQLLSFINHLKQLNKK